MNRFESISDIKINEGEAGIYPHGMRGIDPVHIHILVYRTLAVINYTNEFEVW